MLSKRSWDLESVAALLRIHTECDLVLLRIVYSTVRDDEGNGRSVKY